MKLEDNQQQDSLPKYTAESTKQWHLDSSLVNTVILAATL